MCNQRRVTAICKIMKLHLCCRPTVVHQAAGTPLFPVLVCSSKLYLDSLWLDLYLQDCRVQPTEWLENGSEWPQTCSADAQEDPGVLPWQKGPHRAPSWSITTHRNRAGQRPVRPQYLKWHAVELQKVNKRHHRVLQEASRQSYLLLTTHFLHVHLSALVLTSPHHLTWGIYSSLM